MGQIKGNPALDRTPERQAYTDFYGVGSAAYRDGGMKPVMIDDNATLNEVVDVTFETDAVAAMVSASIETTLATKATTAALTSVSASIETTLATKATTAALTSVSASIETTLATKATTAALTSVSASIATRFNNTAFNYITGSFANDGAAAAAGVPIGGLYHTTGTVKVRLS